MKARLKELYSLDIDHQLSEYMPEDRLVFGFSICMMIGPADEEGAESFDVLLCTPEWIKKKYGHERLVWGLHMIVVLEYDYDLIKREIEKYCGQFNERDWPTLASKLSRVGHWEFEDYKQDPYSL